MNDKSEEQKAFEAGAEAAKGGGRLSDNPHKGANLRFNWFRGFSLTDRRSLEPCK